METIITSNQKIRVWQEIKDIWNYRDLFYAFVERDLKIRYKQTLLGVLWVIIPSLTLSSVFTIIFSKIVPMSTQGLPALLFFLSATLPWNCFANGLSQAAYSLESSASLLSKVYFPRLIAPMAMLFGATVDFIIGWIFFNIMAMAWGYWTWLFIPLTPILLGLQLSAAMGIGLVLAAINAQFRDIRYVIPFITSLGMWLTPVVWPARRLLETRWGESLGIFLYLNPMAGVIESYRALLAGNYLPYRLVAVNLIIALALLVFGIIFFKKREQQIMDLL